MNIRMNMSTFDRGVRLTVGILLFVLIALATFSTLIEVILLLTAFILVATAVAGFCPLYRLFGLSTLRPGAPERHTRPL